MVDVFASILPCVEAYITHHKFLISPKFQELVRWFYRLFRENFISAVQHLDIHDSICNFDSILCAHVGNMLENGCEKCYFRLVLML